MADPPRYPRTDDADDRPDHGSTDAYPGTPRWVKVFGIIALLLALLLMVVMATGVGGSHGPGRHMPSGAVGRMPAVAERVQRP